MGRILLKPGVDLGTDFAPAGARILEHLKACARSYAFDVTITSARDGQHSGPKDPHHSGEAFDLRTHGLTDLQRNLLLADVVSLGSRFFAFLEAAGTANEHIHVQRRRGTVYSAVDYLNNA